VGFVSHGLGLLQGVGMDGCKFGYFWFSRAELATLWWYIENRNSCKQAPTSKPCAPADIYTAFELRGADRQKGDG
jgi:hypothetical protein